MPAFAAAAIPAAMGVVRAAGPMLGRAAAGKVLGSAAGKVMGRGNKPESAMEGEPVSDNQPLFESRNESFSAGMMTSDPAAEAARFAYMYGVHS